MNKINDICIELERTLKSISFEEQCELAEKILAANRVFLAGAGRSGMMVRCFAMRLMHMGLSVYMVGEVVTPSIQKGDLLIIASGSGTTASLVKNAEKARSIGADVATVTIYPEAAIARLSSTVITINAPTAKSEVDNGFTSVQPMGSMFEQSLLICLDNVVLILMDKMNLTSDEMFKRHANLE